MPAPEVIILRQADGFILRTDGRVMRSKDGIYTTWELDDLIYNQGYIPVASAAELNSLRNTGSRTIGAGTIWAGTYTTGLDKKYIQVRSFSLSEYNWQRIGDNTLGSQFSGIYNGNNLIVSEIIMTGNPSETGRAMFGGISDGCILKNIIITNGINTTDSPATRLSILCALCLEGALIENCKVINGTLTGTNTQNGLICGTNSGTIRNCIASGTLSGRFIGGICGWNQLTGIIENCHSTIIASVTVDVGGICAINDTGAKIKYCSSVVDITTTGGSTALPGGAVVVGAGGIAGANRMSTIEYSYCSGTITITGSGNNARRAGGLTAINYETGAVISNCHSSVNVLSASGTLLGGLVGQNFMTITNCYSIGQVTGISDLGGLVGWVSGGTITNSYYDTQTSGRSDTGRGLPRTTAQMKAGTASSFILANGDIDPDSLAANAMYTSWNGDTWDFRTTNDYPILKP
jgi:hypothetical protein